MAASCASSASRGSAVVRPHLTQPRTLLGAGTRPRGGSLRAWLPILLADGLTEGKLTGLLLLESGYRPPEAGGGRHGQTRARSRSGAGTTWCRSRGRSSPSLYRDKALGTRLRASSRTPADLEKRVRAPA